MEVWCDTCSIFLHYCVHSNMEKSAESIVPLCIDFKCVSSDVLLSDILVTTNFFLDHSMEVKANIYECGK